MRVALGPRPRLGPGERLSGTVAVLRARLLVRHRTVEQLRARLSAVGSGCARDATCAEAQRADEIVCAVRPTYLSRDDLERATAATLLCAQHGTRVTWCWGMRTPPVETTTWIEAGGCAFGLAFNVREAYLPLVTTCE